MDKILFKINQNKSIEFKLSDSSREITVFSQISISFNCYEIKNYIIKDEFLIDCLEFFNGLLKKLVKGNLKLHKSINKNIGFLWNQYFYDENVDRSKDWIGEKYYLWSKDKFTYWIYEENKQFFLEITPFYKWDPEKDQNISEQEFQEFMQNYKPYFKTVIEKNYIPDLINQTEDLIKAARFNTDKLLSKSK